MQIFLRFLIIFWLSFKGFLEWLLFVYVLKWSLLLSFAFSFLFLFKDLYIFLCIIEIFPPRANTIVSSTVYDTPYVHSVLIYRPCFLHYCIYLSFVIGNSEMAFAWQHGRPDTNAIYIQVWAFFPNNLSIPLDIFIALIAFMFVLTLHNLHRLHALSNIISFESE